MEFKIGDTVVHNGEIEKILNIFEVNSISNKGVKYVEFESDGGNGTYFLHKCLKYIPQDRKNKFKKLKL